LATHDIITIGASAGGIEALQILVRDLPADLPAAVFVVVHVAPSSPGILPEILSHAGSLPARHPEDGEPIELGQIYIAPPDCHLLVDRSRVRVVRGPKENLHRPAVDTLFRSAARAYGHRVAAVVLSGMLDDGSSGLLAVKRCGGIAIVQDPDEALYPDMPRNALEAVKTPDYVLPLRQIAPTLIAVAGEAVGKEGGCPMAEQMDIENQFAHAEIPPVEMMDKLGSPSVYTCPDCHGTLWEIDEEGTLRFRCRVGHAYSAQSFLAAHGDWLEQALWTALRTLEESASLSRRMAERANREHMTLSASRFMEKAVEAEEHAANISRILRTNQAIEEQKVIEDVR
jgi:two-component system chemotaxis response regulator CheB